MVIELNSRRSLEERLEMQINRENFSPKKADLVELVENILICYNGELEDTGKEFLYSQGDRFSDIVNGHAPKGTWLATQAAR